MKILTQNGFWGRLRSPGPPWSGLRAVSDFSEAPGGREEGGEEVGEHCAEEHPGHDVGARDVDRPDAGSLFECNEEEQKLALFFLCLQSYSLLMDFHVEVTLKKWRAMSLSLERFDLQMRLDEIASFDEKVDGWTELTKSKTIEIYLRILSDIGLLKEGQLTKPAPIEPDFWHYFIIHGEAWFIEACFFTKDQI